MTKNHRKPGFWTRKGAVIFYMGGWVGFGTECPRSDVEVMGELRADKLVGDGSGLTNLPRAASPASWGSMEDVPAPVSQLGLLKPSAGFLTYKGDGFVALTAAEVVKALGIEIPVMPVMLSASRAEDATRTAVAMLDDDALTLSVDASAVYAVELFVLYRTTGTGTMKAQLAAPSGSLLAVSDTASGGIVQGLLNALTLGPTASADKALTMIGVLRTGKTAGPLSLQWGASSLLGGSVTVRTGSYIRATKIN